MRWRPSHIYYLRAPGLFWLARCKRWVVDGEGLRLCRRCRTMRAVVRAANALAARGIAFEVTRVGRTPFRRWNGVAG